jgi:hypothetical protein
MFALIYKYSVRTSQRTDELPYTFSPTLRTYYHLTRRNPFIWKKTMYVYRNTDERSRIIVVVKKRNILHICLCAYVCTRVRVLRVPRRVRVRVCSVAYPTCNSYAPCSDVICGFFGLYHIFRHYLINGKKKVIELKMCSDSLYKFYPKYFLLQGELSEILS